MKAIARFSENAITRLRAEIKDAGGNEVMALGFLDDKGLVGRITVSARGNEGSVLALLSDGGAAIPDVFIHNHPSGYLSPSENDIAIAGRAAEGGVGAFIVDNQVEQVYVIAEPIKRRSVKKLESSSITAALEAGGAISRRLPAWEPRQSQLDMMRLVIRAFNDDTIAAAEAGTGVGKSFAYLLPAIHYAIENEERIVISTATITLQQQLFDKDIPLVAGALGKKVKAVLMKGRGNYLCRRRLEDAIREPSLAPQPSPGGEGSPFDEGENDEIARIVAWTETTKTVSRSDLAFVPLEAVWSRICSEADMCMGMRCPERERCFVLALRKEAADARILVVNHHLLFADLAARQEGAGYDNTVVLPPYTRVVIDEAHTVEGAATSFFSKEFSRLGIYRQLGRLYRRRRVAKSGLLVRLASLVRMEDKLDEGVAVIDKIRETADDLDTAAQELCGGDGVFRLIPARNETAGMLFPFFITLKKKIATLGEIIRDMLENVSPDDEDNSAVWEIKTIQRRLETIGGVCSSFIEYRERPMEVMWLERHQSKTQGFSGEPWVVFTVTPVDIAPSLKESLFEPNKTVICCSATLTVADSFSYWSGQCGLNLINDKERKVLTGRFPSPFPYASSVLLAVPSDAPLPEEGGYQSFVDKAAARLAVAAGGSALILFTSYQSLRSAYSVAAPELQKQGIRCLKQGDDDRSRLLSDFLNDETSVLFATDSFWEGVDAPGNTLRLVILCRLPFRTPNDPVFEARREALEKQGRNPFMELSLPESVMKFKQGFGRLMRRSSDHGVVVVLDGRILRKRYGEFFLKSLPETRTSFGEFSSIVRDTEDFLHQ
jgi:ATP-dependent DNA helicase DinG